MATSSVLFGGFSLWNGRSSPSDSLPPLTTNMMEEASSHFYRLFDWQHWFLFRAIAYVQSIEPGTYAWIVSTLCLLLLLAYSTTPSDSSFHSYLTEQSLHQHLRQLHQDNAIAQASLSGDESEGSSRQEAEKRSTPHVLTFANRISVSLRTPRYIRRDYGIFCIVDVPRFQSIGKKSNATSSTCTRYIGVFGKWQLSGTVTLQEHRKTKGGKQNPGQAKDAWGVLQMKNGGDATEDEDNTFRSEKIVDEKQGTAVGKDNGKGSSAPRLSDTKSIGKRKKQTQKARPTQPIPAGEASPADRRPPDEITNPSRSNHDNADKLNIAETSPQAGHLESNGNAAALADFQAQLEQIRTTSDTSRKQLQAQLEEMRARKRDEDAARLDVKGRVKTLDESKRHAEGIKREAERRLKAANGVKEAIQNRIDGKSREIEMLQKQQTLHEAKVIQSGERKIERIAEMKAETQSKEQQRLLADEELEQLKAKLEKLQNRLLEEEANLEAAHELAIERDQAAAATHLEYTNSNHGYANMYPLLSGPGDMPDTSTNESFYSDWSANGNHRATSSVYQSPRSQLAMTNDRIKSRQDLDDTFDPTLVPNQSSRQEHVESTFAPFSFDQRSFAPNSIAIGGTYDAENSSMPPTPFTSNLLPSNLFQNADDDERHEGVLPGSRAERVEAALNRFGLDSSDSSDHEEAEEEESKRDKEISDAEAKQEDTQGEEEGKSEKEERVASKEGQPRMLSRGWWGGRARNASKDRANIVNSNNSGIENRLPMAISSSDAILDTNAIEADPAKKRSLSIFPKLSLNPGAKSFRGVNKRHELDGSTTFSLGGSGGANSYDSGLMQSMWNNSTGQLPTGQDFESMKRAFQTNNLIAAQEDEEQGRRSWSAFDTWQQQQQQSQGGLKAVNTSISTRQGSRYPSNLGPFAASTQATNLRASSDSVAQRRAFLTDHNTSPNQVDWLEDAILPLHKTHSMEGDSITSTTSVPRTLRNGSGKASRFAFWNSSNSANGSSNGNGDAHTQVSDLSSSASAFEEGNGDKGTISRESSPAPAITSSSNGVVQPSKRSSFRWSRRQEPLADLVNTIDKSKD